MADEDIQKSDDGDQMTEETSAGVEAVTEKKPEEGHGDKSTEEAPKAEVKTEEVTPQPTKTEKSSSAKATEDKPAPTGKFAELIKEIENLSALELSELVKALEDRFGVSAAAPIMMAGPMAGAAAAPAEVAEEKTHYTLVLTESGAQKIAVIKAIREILPDLGLKEAKDLVDSAPKTVKENMPKAEAEEGKKKLETAGGKAELK